MIFRGGPEQPYPVRRDTHGVLGLDAFGEMAAVPASLTVRKDKYKPIRIWRLA
jgi:hypothetical protein